jgi:RNA polymerase sigma-70 factor (ECF subfamily)
MTSVRAIAYDSLPEAALADLARGGDRLAFAEVMQRCNQRLFRIARAVVGDDAEAEDVLQEAYTRAFAAIGGFRGEAGLATWLTRIVLNEARGRLRRRRPQAPIEEIEVAQAARILPFPGRPAVDDPEREAARDEIRRIVERAVDDLPEPFRLIFILREVEELSVEETAAQLQIRPETVKTRLHRARRRLREALDERLSDAITGAFPFLGERCNRITGAVLKRLEAKS